MDLIELVSRYCGLYAEGNVTLSHLIRIISIDLR